MALSCGLPRLNCKQTTCCVSDPVGKSLASLPRSTIENLALPVQIRFGYQKNSDFSRGWINSIDQHSAVLNPVCR